MSYIKSRLENIKPKTKILTDIKGDRCNNTGDMVKKMLKILIDRFLRKEFSDMARKALHLIDILKKSYCELINDETSDFLSPRELRTITRDWLPLIKEIEGKRPDAIRLASCTNLNSWLEHSLYTEIFDSGYEVSGCVGTGKDIDPTVYFWASKIVTLFIELFKLMNKDAEFPDLFEI